MLAKGCIDEDGSQAIQSMDLRKRVTVPNANLRGNGCLV